MGNRQQWATDFLLRIGAPPSDENLIAMMAWIASEFGSTWPIPAAYNCMATTYHRDGATDYNSVGVKNYATWSDGVEANALTLLEDHPGYDAIRSHFASDARAEDTADAIAASAWGSHPSTALVETVRRDPAFYFGLEVGEHTDEDNVPPSTTPVQAFPTYPGVPLRNFHKGDGTAMWQSVMAERGWTIAVDDKYGPQSEAVCRAFQQEKADEGWIAPDGRVLDVDGIVGPLTWAAAWLAPVT